MIKEIRDDGLCSFPNKRPGETERLIDNNESLLYVFVYKPIQKNHTNKCDIILKGTYEVHLMDYFITVQFDIDM